MAFPAGGYADLAAAIADGLMSYVPFDETQGYVATDLVTGHNLNVWRGPAEDSITVGVYGNARSLYNVYGSDTIPRSTRISRLDLGSNTRTWTAAFRFKAQDPPGPSTGGAHPVLSYHVTTSNRALLVQYGNSFNVPATSEFRILGAIQPSFVLTGVDMPTTGVWHSIVVVSDEALLQTRLYIDGVLRATQAQSLFSLRYAGPESTIEAGSATVAARVELDDFCAWDRIFTDQEAADFHNSPVMPNQGVVGEPLANEAHYLTSYSELNYTPTSLAKGAAGRLVLGADDNASQGHKLFVSDDDGVSWAARELLPVETNRGVNSVAYDGVGLWVAAGDRGRIWTSVDNGDTWVVREPGVTGWFTTNYIQYVVYGEGVWLFVGSQGRVASMTDPVNGVMTQFLQSDFNNVTAYGAAYHDGVWLISALTNYLFKSVDGAQTFVNIAASIPLVNPICYAIAHTGEAFVVGGGWYNGSSTRGRVFKSLDAVTWVVEETPEIDAAGGLFYIGGGLGQFVASNASGASVPHIAGDSSVLVKFFPDTFAWASRTIFYDADNQRFIIPRSSSSNRGIFTYAVETVPQQAAISVVVSIEAPIVRAATMVTVTVDKTVGVLAAQVREAEVSAEVAVSSIGYARSGYFNLLAGLHSYYPFDRYNHYNPNAVAENDTVSVAVNVHGIVNAGLFETWETYRPDSDQFLLTHQHGALRFNTLEVMPLYPELDWDDRNPYVLVDGFESSKQEFTVTYWIYVQRRPVDLGPGEDWYGIFHVWGDGADIHLRVRRILPEGAVLDEEREPLLTLDFRGEDGLGPVWPAVSPWEEMLSDGSRWPKYVLPYDQWVFVNVTRRGSRFVVYMDRQLVFDVVLKPISYGYKVYLGSYRYLVFAGGVSMWGFLDEAGVWHKELQYDELDRLYADGIGLAYPFSTEVFLRKTIGVTTQNGSFVDYRNFRLDAAFQHFIGVITGAEDGVEDALIPISYWQATRQVPEQSSYLQMLIPATTEAMNAVTARPNGVMKVRSRYKTGPYTWEEDFTWAPVQEIDISRTTRSQALQLQGRQLIPAPEIPMAWVVADDEVMRFDVQAARRRVRLPINLWMRPGESVTVLGETFVIGWINLYANRRGVFMDVGEVGG